MASKEILGFLQGIEMGGFFQCLCLEKQFLGINHEEILELKQCATLGTFGLPGRTLPFYKAMVILYTLQKQTHDFKSNTVCM